MDRLVEMEENIIAVLSSQDNAVIIGLSSAIVTITDSDGMYYYDQKGIRCICRYTRQTSAIVLEI